jgi:hypothetical protein
VVLRLTAAGRKFDRPAPNTVEWIVRRALRTADRAAVAATVRLLTDVAEGLQAAAGPTARDARGR